MIYKIAGLVTHSVTSNLMLSLNSLLAAHHCTDCVVCSTRDVIMTTTAWQRLTKTSIKTMIKTIILYFYESNYNEHHIA